MHKLKEKNKVPDMNALDYEEWQSFMILSAIILW